MDTNIDRHPDVVDLLGGAPTGPSDAANTVAPDGPSSLPPVLPPEPSNIQPRPSRKRVLAAASGAVGIAIAVGAVWGVVGDRNQEPPAPATVEAEDAALPTLNLPEPPTAATDTDASTDVTDECRADRGDQNSGAGVIAAWNHAYYAQRNAQVARSLATPNSTIVPADQLQPFIDAVPPGTNYCVAITPLSESAYSVDLTELRPEGPLRIPQTITTKKIDGKWFVDVVS